MERNWNKIAAVATLVGVFLTSVIGFVGLVLMWWIYQHPISSPIVDASAPERSVMPIVWWMPTLIVVGMLGAGVLHLLAIRAAARNRQDSIKGDSTLTNLAPELKDEDKIKITLPPDGVLTGRKQFGKASFSYAVYGTLKDLPNGCEIWLLNADKLGQEFWPQGFDLVPHNPRTGEWNGRINVPRGQNSVNIFAVVAPPTSQQLFRYYEEVGRERYKENEKRPEAERVKRPYAPLRRIPEECKNTASVLATVPPE